MVAYKFSKKNHFFTCLKTYNVSRHDHPNFDEIVRLHTIMFDKYVRFNNYFRKILWHLIGTKFKFSSVYHKSLGDLSRCLRNRISESASSFDKHIRILHKEISDKINLSNQRYKWLADSRQQAKNFAKDDHIMIRVRSEQFLSKNCSEVSCPGNRPI